MGPSGWPTSLTAAVLLLSAGCGFVPPQIQPIMGYDASAPFERQLVRVDSREQAPIWVAAAACNPSWTHLALPFRLVEMPKTAVLEVIATGIAPACPVTGQPQGSTAISINKHSVTRFTLGPEGKGRTYGIKADLDIGTLRIGDNLLEITGTMCSLGRYEVVNFNGIALTAPPK